MHKMPTFAPMRKTSITLLTLLVLCISSTFAQRLTPSHIELGKSVVAKYDDTDAWLEYFEFRFKQRYPSASEAFFVSVRPEIDQLAKIYDDSLGMLYTKRLSEKELLSLLKFVESPLGTRYRQFLTVGIRERFDAGEIEKMAPRVVKRYRIALLKDSSYQCISGNFDVSRAHLRMASYFANAPVASELEDNLLNTFDTVPPRTWDCAFAELTDSVVGQIARIAPDYLTEKEIGILDSMFATSAGRPLDARVHRAWFGALQQRHQQKFMDTYFRRWKSYEYALYRYPKLNQEIEFRGLNFKIIHKGETENGVLNPDYDGVRWLVVAKGFKGKDQDYAVMSRWLADYRFMLPGDHKIYFLKKEIDLTEAQETAITFEDFLDQIKKEDPKSKKLFVGMERISGKEEMDESRDMDRTPLQ